MSDANPQTLDEWAEHIAGLSGADLSSKAAAANQIAFVRDLREEGYAPAEVETIFVLLAKQLVRAGQPLPDAGYTSYRRLAQREPPIPIELPRAPSRPPGSRG